MPLTPVAARPWTGPDSRNRPWSSHGAMMIRRREALTALYTAYGSWVRLALGALAWALGTAGAVLIGQGLAAGEQGSGEGQGSILGFGLLLVAIVLGAFVVVAGSVLARATAAWWTLATAVSADGGRVRGASPDPHTQHAHEEVRSQDRTGGGAELWQMPLLPRTVAALLAGSAAVVLLAQAALGYVEGAADGRAAGEAQLGAAAVCAITAALTAAGLRRIHRARMHRVQHAEQARPAPAAGGTFTPALGTGAIVVGGRATAPPPAAQTGALPAWVQEAAPAPRAPGSDDAAPAHHAVPAPVAAPVDDVAPGSPGEVVRVRLSDGRELTAGVTLVGRAPRPRPDEEADVLLAVTDERVSKTHLTVRLEPGRAVVLDRGSTNGTVVHRPDGTTQPLRPGEEYELAEGDVVVLGVTTLSVGEPAEDVEHTVLRGPAEDDVEHTVLRGRPRP